MVHSSQVGNSKALPVNGASSMLLAAPTFLSPMVSRRMQSNKPRACLRNVREMVQTPCVAFLTSVLGSPAQRLMSRRTRCVLPVAKKLLIPKPLNTRNVSSRLKLKRQQQKSYHDQHAKSLQPLRSQQVMRLQTDRGYQKVGVVKQPAPQSQSYIVEAEGKQYRRNRRHLLSVPEPAPAKLTCPAVTDDDAPYVPPSRMVQPSLHLSSLHLVPSLHVSSLL